MAGAKSKRSGWASKLAGGGFGLLVSMLLLGASTRAAYAYLDAGTGSMILQVLLGGVAGIALVGKLYWHRLLVMLRIRDDVPPGDVAGDEASKGPAGR